MPVLLHLGFVPTRKVRIDIFEINAAVIMIIRIAILARFELLVLLLKNLHFVQVHILAAHLFLLLSEFRVILHAVDIDGFARAEGLEGFPEKLRVQAHKFGHDRVDVLLLVLRQLHHLIVCFGVRHLKGHLRLS
jgi:hypothetical protein